LETFNVKLKDGRIVQLRLFQPEDKERLVEMYESLSGDAVRWALRHTQGKDLKRNGLEICSI